MKKCPRILLLKDGRQHMIGTNTELEQQGFNSDEILQNYTQNLKKQDSKTEIQTMQQVTHD
jgi:hypothetical protein